MQDGVHEQIPVDLWSCDMVLHEAIVDVHLCDQREVTEKGSDSLSVSRGCKVGLRGTGEAMP